MNKADAERWKSQVLDDIFVALAASKPLEESLVFKGARVLNVLLGGGRQSLDLDSNLATPFVQKYPNRETQRAFLQEEMTQAVRRHFEGQDPVRYELSALTVRTYPPKSHPMGWAIEQIQFWRRVGQEFQIACQSRYIDCDGLATFREQWAVTRTTYGEAIIPKDISFEEVEETVEAVVGFLETHGFVPFTFPLPQTPTS